MNNRVTVLLTSRSSFFRAYLRIAIEGRPRFRVIGEAFSPSVAIAIATQKRPEIVVLDYRHSGKIFFDCIHKITQVSGACVLIGTLGEEPLIAERARESGAAAVLIQNSDPENLIRKMEEICG